MGILKEAVMEQGAAKMALFGPQGSGKTSDAVQIAIGLSLNHHKNAPIAFFDTEKGSDFALALTGVEGVKMLRIKSRSFSDLLASVKEAETAGCCALIVDSMSHVWTEIMDAFCRARKIKRIEFQHWRELKAMWQQWTDAMLNSPLHMVICGRAGKTYEYQENEETGKQELITTGTKFKAEGEFGYEPDVLVELWAERLDKKTGKHSQLVHKGLVLKDRTWAVNGREFSWKDKANYKKGDYKLVFDCFAPYFNYLKIGGAPSTAIHSERNSDAMFDRNGDSQWARDRQQKEVVLEEIQNTIQLVWPGQDAGSKRIRILAMEAIWSVRAWSAVQQKTLPQLEHGLKVLRKFEELARDSSIEGEAGALAVLGNALAFISDEDSADAFNTIDVPPATNGTKPHATAKAEESGVVMAFDGR